MKMTKPYAAPPSRITLALSSQVSRALKVCSMAYQDTQTSIVDKALSIGLKELLLADDPLKDDEITSYFYNKLFSEEVLNDDA